MTTIPEAKLCTPVVSTTMAKLGNKLQSKCYAVLPAQEFPSSRRTIISCTSASLVAVLAFYWGLTPLPVWAEDKPTDGVLGAVKSMFDSNEKTKSGKVLPKAYLRSAREVVKTLRQSLDEDRKDIAKFRRTADAAKESIREYLSSWKGQLNVVGEESYVMLEKAIRSLASFYSKAGPSATLPDDVKSEILNDLNTAEQYL
ncbi:PSII_Pbs27 domain-containing protein [Cephalotus follicularis]|uniref:PSII_Pbs27 domain-containing protein n=1 Tax=Cephalotus follicularis TaxID=3775 RepID=A0A1Q3CX98_CEPFO|nr:PSII_Pbs27 domain-containing protein [Cephalotus follicularis]